MDEARACGGETMPDVRRWEDADCWVEVDLALCTAARDCLEVCPVGVYELVDGKVEAEGIGNCMKCGSCQDACPANAILRHWAW